LALLDSASGGRFLNGNANDVTDTCGTLALGENAKVVIDNASSLTDEYDALDLMTLTDKTFPRIPECTGISDAWRLRVVDAGKTLRLYRNRRMHLIIR
jgi:hypothetical protein